MVFRLLSFAFGETVKTTFLIRIGMVRFRFMYRRASVIYGKPNDHKLVFRKLTAGILISLKR